MYGRAPVQHLFLGRQRSKVTPLKPTPNEGFVMRFSKEITPRLDTEHKGMVE